MAQRKDPAVYGFVCMRIRDTDTEVGTSSARLASSINSYVHNRNLAVFEQTLPKGTMEGSTDEVFISAKESSLSHVHILALPIAPPHRPNY